jgi:hypothetical protein
LWSSTSQVNYSNRTRADVLRVVVAKRSMQLGKTCLIEFRNQWQYKRRRRRQPPCSLPNDDRLSMQWIITHRRDAKNDISRELIKVGDGRWGMIAILTPREREYGGLSKGNQSASVNVTALWRRSKADARSASAHRGRC